MRLVFLLLFILIGIPTLAQPVKTRLEEAQFPTESPLNSGAIYRLAITEENIYKIDHQLLSSLGINPAGIDPSRIKIYGNGGQQLPQSNSEPRYWGLQENAIEVTGAEDGRFDTQDLIIFYGQTSHPVVYDQESGEYNYRHNPYADTTYYFLKVEGNPGRRITTQPGLEGQFPLVTTTEAFFIHEIDQRNLLSSGRIWLGEALNNRFDLALPTGNLASEGVIDIHLSLASTASTANTLNIGLGSAQAGTMQIPALLSCEYCDKGILQNQKFQVPVNQVVAGSSQNLSLVLGRSTAGNPVAYLDHLFVVIPQKLVMQNKTLLIQSKSTLEQPFSTFELLAEQPIKVWDISDPLTPFHQEIKSGAGKVNFSIPTMNFKKLVAFKPAQLPKPLVKGPVANQNLLNLPVPDLLIVTAPEFQSEAQRLASFRNTHDQLQTAVVTTSEVFNEFSSGNQDVAAIRDFARFLRNRSGGEKFKYLLLFGKGSFDYKDILPGNQNFVPVYQSLNSFDPIFSYCSDDFYGFLDLEEGNWDESTDDYDLDLAIGRLPVVDHEEAQVVVNKLIDYASSSQSGGNWRQRIFFLADDGNDKRDFLYYLQDSENLYNFLKVKHSQFEVKKFYVDAYPQLIGPGREEVPDLIEDFEKNLKQGALIVNYSGHGSRRELASERIIDLASVNRYSNYPQLPLFITATCEFGEHDNPAFRSGAEYLLVNPKGGAIGLISTARPVYASTNFLLNRSFYETFYQIEDGRHLTVGEIFRKTKNKSVSGTLNRSFTLLGDPSMTLNFPKKQVKITRINETAVDATTDTLKALQIIKIEGEVLDLNGNRAGLFNGKLDFTLYDKERRLQTLGNGGPATNFLVRDNALFRGQASIENGRFNFEFQMPKNITYQLGEGKISLYALSDDGMDGGGAETSFLIGSSAVDYESDNQPPEISLYLDDETFRNGSITHKHPWLLAHLQDESGIDISRGNLNTSLRAILDDDRVFELNDYYQANLDDYRNGVVRFPLRDLAPGKHTLVLKARDIYNNPSEAAIEFIVTDQQKVLINNLLNFPNPFNNSTVFTFQHNQAGRNLTVDLEIFTVSGKQINRITYIVNQSPALVSLPEWFGTDTFGKKLQSGIYLYRLTVRSNEDDIIGSAINKLILSNQ